MEEILGKPYHYLGRLEWHMTRKLGGLDLKDKNILDIGAGAGADSIYFALHGAKVVAVEPELAGINSGALSLFKKRVKDLDLTNIKIIKEDFQKCIFNEEQFDVIYSNNSINHIFEITEKIVRNDENYRIFYNIFRSIYKYLKFNGILIVSDASRYNLFAYLNLIGLKNPLNPSINWKIHQSPKTWKIIMEDVGFRDITIKWYLPYCLRKFELFFDNEFFSWFTWSIFTIIAKK